MLRQHVSNVHAMVVDFDARWPGFRSVFFDRITETDRWDNKWLSKQRAINKIDAAVALCMAVGAAMAGDNSSTIDDWLKSLAS